MRIGVAAPASPVGQIELANGVEALRKRGFDVVVHPNCAKQHFLFAGTDVDRATAFYELAKDRSIEAIWAAGGGYGVTRMLPLVEELAEERGTPGAKLLVGYSDITALHDFVRSRWGWSSLHFPMPSAGHFCEIDPKHFDAAVMYVNHQRPPDPWGDVKMKFLLNEPTSAVHGVMVGGNLSLWAATAGTPFAPIASPGRIVFLEDVDEAPYRIDRMITQVLQSGTFFGAKAIVLGDYTRCEDDPSSVLVATGAAEKKLLRPKVSLEDAIKETFVPLGEKLGIPVAIGLPVGHGPNYAPLPLGAEYILTPAGTLHLEKWNWLES